MRFLDLIFSVAGIVISLPALLIIYLIGLFDTGSPIFRQERVGRNQSPFLLVKFRTMRPNTLSVGSHLVDPSAITKFGAILRRSKLDELPQLWNVIKGDVSFIGPRPLEIRYLPLYTIDQNRRHEVKPGLSGWAQVNGRNSIGWEKKIEFDLFYVDNQSFQLDLKIFFLTIKKVLIGSGVNGGSDQTVEPFDVYLNKKKNDF